MGLMINPFEDIFDSLDWDKNFYKFTRDEKDMYPYTVNHQKDGSIILVHNVVGLDKKDLKLSTKLIDNKGFIVIEGQTKDEITNKTYSINSKFSFDINSYDMENIKSTMKNGLLYITIATKPKEEPKTNFINID